MNSKLPIYLDYMATTPVDHRVIEKMLSHLGLDGCFGNPASVSHIYGKMALEVVENARAQIAEQIHAQPQEIIFTSGATEANNLAILGAARFYQTKGRHLITLRTEHKAVLDSFEQLQKEGFSLTYLTPQADGLLNLQDLKDALREDTILVSIMQVNNEIGVIQDIAAIGELLSNQGIIFHVDAAQSAGKLAIDLSKLAVDLMSISGHKIYGPKGIGALYIRQKPRIRLQALSFGGGHEKGLRSGTLPTHQIVGLAEALVLAKTLAPQEQQRILQQRQRLWQGIRHLPGIQLNGNEINRVAGNLNLSFAGIDGDSLMLAFNALALSTTSACIAASQQPSYVLKALGLNDELAYSSIRISIGRFTSEEEISETIAIICQQVNRLHEISPL
ncbi:MAG: IscS subfamily cysteine desulfurase [Tatlockia sp.]|nr:IscS subfamily cysteine desulfurase [Tatlockia sp.]